jgi:hypothetical protein
MVTIKWVRSEISPRDDTHLLVVRASRGTPRI